MNHFWGGKTIFVTGSTGFVGSGVTRMLIERGARVISLQREVKRTNALELWGLQSKVTIVQGEIDDLNLLTKTISENQIDAVFHFAAQALAGTGDRSPSATFETNIRGTYLLLEACRIVGGLRSIVFASSENAYGSHQLPPYLEDFPLQGRTPYEVSKSCSDLIAQSFAATYNLPITIVRPANTYGGGDLNLSRIIPGTILAILKNERPIIRSDGTPIREFIHIQDVAEAFLLLSENVERSQGQAFNLGSNEPIQMADLVRTIIDLMGKTGELEPEILQAPIHGEKVDAQFLSSEMMHRTFGWRAKIGLSEGLKQTIDWYQRRFDDLI